MGRLELIIGPMFASKSSELIRLANRYKSIGKKILSINHKINNRYGTDKIITHDFTTLPDSIMLEKIEDIFKIPMFAESDIILIEELQFFSDALDNIIKIVDTTDKVVIAAGLVADYKRREFGDVLKLIPHAEKVIKLSALCKYCSDGTPADFTKKISTNDDNRIKIGSQELYQAVCRKHYLYS